MIKNRLRELDIIRAIAFILVVDQHIIGGWSYIKTLPKCESLIMKFLYIVGTPAVPMFLAISGVSLMYVYMNNLNVKKYYVKRIRYILIPYIIWSAIDMYMLGEKDKFENFIANVITGNGAYFLWYMGMIMRLYLIIPLVILIVRKIHKLNKYTRIIMFLIQFPIYYYISTYSYSFSIKLGKFIFINPTELQQKFINISIINWSLYFIIGIYIANYYNLFKKTIKKYKWCVVVGYFITLAYEYLKHIEVVKYYLLLHIGYTVCSIMFVYLIGLYLSQSKLIYKVLKFIGDYSFAGYMAHVIFINYFVQRYVVLFNIRDKFLLGMLVCISTSIITPIFIALISLIPGSCYVTGVKKKGYKQLVNILKNNVMVKRNYF